MATMSEKQQKDFEYFSSNLPEFLKTPTLKNKFLVIKDKEIKNSFDTFDRAIEFAVSKFDDNEFIIQQVIDENDKINFIYCSQQ